MEAKIVLGAKDTTGPAFASAQRNFQQLQAGAVAITGAVGLAVAGVASVVETLDRLNPKPIIDAADQLNKLSQRTGIAVETLSAYQYAAKLADVSNDELSASLKRLNINIAAAARGEAEQAGAFKAIGVSVVDSAGKVRTADQVFEDIADRFASYADGPKKSRLPTRSRARVSSS